MSGYEALYLCYTMGQMSEGQFQEHLKSDEVFKAWLARRMKAGRR